jgi:pimeloyl-ACP methyl ester carboxylesterase
LLLLALAMLLAWPFAPAQATADSADVRYLTVVGADGVPLHVVSAGDPDAPGILLLHGVGQSHFMFSRQFASSLASDYHLVSFDLRGHGNSGKPWAAAAYTEGETWAADVAAVVAATGLERPVVVAWSYGALVALDYLRAQGADSLRGLVLTGSLGALVPFRFSPDAELTADFQRVRQQQLSPDPRQQAAAVEQMIAWLTAAPVDAADRIVMGAVAMQFPAYARRAIYQRRADNTDLLPLVAAIPTVLAMGSEDNAAMVEDAAALAERFPALEFSRYEGAGHSVFYEQPDRFNRELRALLRRAGLARQGTSTEER